MPYKVVFRKEENGKSEIVIKADRTRYDKDSGFVEFIDEAGIKIAFIPVDRILYVKKAETD